MRLAGSLFLIGALFAAGQATALYIAAVHAGGFTAALTQHIELGIALAGLAGFAIYLLFGLVLWSKAGSERLSRAAERIASGDLTLRASRGATGTDDGADADHTWTAMRQMSANLAEIVTRVRSSAEAILAGSAEIAGGYASLSERTEQQASTLEEIASGMEELSGTIKQNAEHCRRADGVALQASDITTQSAQSMQRLFATMQRIEVDARKVSDIVGVIEGIAFQTNILALNAAVEASRAGDQGRGFAVVASEVRSLAQRSEAAAKEIKSLIAHSGAGVAEGACLAGEAGQTIGHAAERVREVSALINEIATASAEQSKGVEEINKAILQLEDNTQQNASLVEQSTAAALEFEDQARRLAETVDAFKLDRMEAREQAVALVKRAVAHVRQHGIAIAARDFNDGNGAFMDGELYIIAFDEKAKLLAMGANPGLVGADHWEQTDVDGKKMTQEMIRVALTRGVGWVDYRWKNPKSGAIEPKSTYVERAGDYIVGCGIYRREAAAPALQGQPQMKRLGARKAFQTQAR